MSAQHSNQDGRPQRTAKKKQLQEALGYAPTKLLAPNRLSKPARKTAVPNPLRAFLPERNEHTAAKSASQHPKPCLAKLHEATEEPRKRKNALSK